MTDIDDLELASKEEFVQDLKDLNSLSSDTISIPNNTTIYNNKNKIC